MSTPASDLVNNINTYLANPTRLQAAVLDFTRQATNGQYEYVDPTNPVVMTVESAVMVSSATLNNYESVLRRQYPSLAQTYDDLFLHMSDKDYLDRFSVPAKTRFTIMFRKEELLAAMVLDPIRGYRKLIIPRNTYFTVAGVDFCIEYPIELRQLNYGGLQISYVTDKESPLMTLSTNIIDWREERTLLGDDTVGTFIRLEIDVIQLSSQTRIFDMTSTTRFSETFSLTDNYYYTRVFIKDNEGAWKEINTTHSEQIYDINTMTAVLKVTDVLTVNIPEIYNARSENTRKVRIDVYETKGPITLMLDSYPMSSFQTTWNALDSSEINEYVAPLQTLSTIIVFSTKSVSGGKLGLSFEQMRERLINNAIGTPRIPISNVQIETSLEDQNYRIVKNIDNVTNRTFLATRELPKPSYPELITAANASIQTGVFSMQDAVKIHTVVDNDDSITITPNTLYQNVNGKVTLLPSDLVEWLLDLPVEQRSIEVNKRDLYYSPFYYVLDSSEHRFESRVYHLDDPSILGSRFIAENDTTLLKVSTAGYRILKKETGYSLQVVVKSTKEYKDLDDDLIYTQLRFKPFEEGEYAYQNGKIIGRNSDDERVFEFDLSTNYRVDKAHNLYLTKFFIYTLDEKDLGTGLLNDFEIIYATSQAMDLQHRYNSVDDVLGHLILPPQIYGITHESLTVRFGYHLDRLWVRGRTIVSDAGYERYALDTVKTYSTNVYEVNPLTGTTIFIENGTPVQHLLHRAGDIVYVDGKVVYENRAGDIVVDELGDPVIKYPRKLLRQVDYLLIEAAYWFSTDTVAERYRKEMTKIYVDWITTGLVDIQQKLIEQTYIYFYPKVSTGDVDIMVKGGVETRMKAAQEFTVKLHVNKNVNSNPELKNQLKIKTIEVLNSQLNRSVISMSRISKELMNIYADDVIDVQISGFSGQEDYRTITMMNDTDRPGIKKLLKAQSDGTLIVDEAVDLQFIEHELD